MKILRLPVLLVAVVALIGFTASPVAAGCCADYCNDLMDATSSLAHEYERSCLYNVDRDMMGDLCDEAGGVITAARYLIMDNCRY